MDSSGSVSAVLLIEGRDGCAIIILIISCKTCSKETAMIYGVIGRIYTRGRLRRPDALNV